MVGAMPSREAKDQGRKERKRESSAYRDQEVPVPGCQVGRSGRTFQPGSPAASCQVPELEREGCISFPRFDGVAADPPARPDPLG